MTHIYMALALLRRARLETWAPSMHAKSQRDTAARSHARQ